jgi:hypothetical protein
MASFARDYMPSQRRFPPVMRCVSSSALHGGRGLSGTTRGLVGLTISTSAPHKRRSGHKSRTCLGSELAGSGHAPVIKVEQLTAYLTAATGSTAGNGSNFRKPRCPRRSSQPAGKWALRKNPQTCFEGPFGEVFRANHGSGPSPAVFNAQNTLANKSNLSP